MLTADGKTIREEAEDSATMLGCLMWLAAGMMILLAILVWACR